MNFKRGKNRTAPIRLDSLEQLVDSSNEVRLIDSFVDSLDLGSLGFDVEHASQGRPPYHPSTLIKLYIYGYLNSIRSSRKLEKASQINLEVMWLLKQLSPDHSTISNFRKEHPQQIKAVFKQAIFVADHFKLIGKELVAGDGTKLAAQNSKKNNYSQKKLDRHIKYINKKLLEYNEVLADADGEKKKELEEKVVVQEERKKKYQELEKELHESEASQISTSDPDARLFANGKGAIVGYNVQSVVDASNNLPIDYEVTNSNDNTAMAAMVERTIETLNLEKEASGKLKESIDGLFDAGYYNGEQLSKVQEFGVTTYVCIPKAGGNSKPPDPAYDRSNFIYNETEDFFTCPQGNKLITNGNWSKCRNKKVKSYKTQACKTCPVRAKCTKAKKAGRVLLRNEYAWACEENQKNMEANPQMYRKRQAIVEHPFGTMKRSWGFNYILTKKGKERASADVGFMFLAYALRRIFNLLDFELLDTYFEGSKAVFLLFRWLGSLTEPLGLDLRALKAKETVLVNRLMAD